MSTVRVHARLSGAGVVVTACRVRIIRAPAALAPRSLVRSAAVIELRRRHSLQYYSLLHITIFAFQLPVQG
eukprot:11194977-Lingulodinium_polyedra.AAC.1